VLASVACHRSTLSCGDSHTCFTAIHPKDHEGTIAEARATLDVRVVSRSVVLLWSCVLPARHSPHR
jgi:hypothetical protein